MTNNVPIPTYKQPIVEEGSTTTTRPWYFYFQYLANQIKSVYSGNLAASGVTAGAYTTANITVNAAGLLTSATSGSAVTSVGLASTDLAVTGSPVTSSGSITANLAAQTSAGSYTNTSVTVNSKGIVTAAASGTGYTGTITTAKLTTANGSMTFVNGILTAQTQAT